jgi:hypothetical protein
MNKERLEKAREDAIEAEMAQYTFKPDINSSESGSLSARESDESVHERLYRMGGKDEVLGKLRGLELELDRDCTFKVRHPLLCFRRVC